MADKKIGAVIPALNEEKTISQVVKGVRQYVDEVILVDDASRDRTADLARQEGAVVLVHKENKGYDKSLDDGFALAHGLVQHACIGADRLSRLWGMDVTRGSNIEPIGPKEKESNTLSVRTLDGKVRYGLSPEELLGRVIKHISNRALDLDIFKK